MDNLSLSDDQEYDDDIDSDLSQSGRLWSFQYSLIHRYIVYLAHLDFTNVMLIPIHQIIKMKQLQRN